MITPQLSTSVRRGPHQGDGMTYQAYSGLVGLAS